MKRFLGLLLSIVIVVPLWAGQPDKKQLLSPDQTLQVLEDVKQYAVTFGNGPEVINTFIDPYCELSQRYLSFIFKKQDRMFSRYTFHFYLYELPGKDSTEMIHAILSSDLKETMLKAVMVDHQQIDVSGDDDAEDAVEAIEEVAKKIGVFKRPYILINGKVK
jgi:glutaredoxin